MAYSRHVYCLIAALLMLGGCGPATEANADIRTSTIKQSTVDGSWGSVSGTVATVLAGRPSLFCGTLGRAGHGEIQELRIYWARGIEMLSLSIPRSGANELSVVSLKDSGANRADTAVLRYRGSSDGRAKTFENTATGNWRWSQLPEREGDAVAGTLTASLTDRNGDLVTIKADFDFAAGIQSFVECPG